MLAKAGIPCVGGASHFPGSGRWHRTVTGTRPRTVTASDTTRRLAALERVRAQLETALSADPDWRALGPAAPSASRAAHERRLASNPVYWAWKLLNRVIDEMRAECTTGDAPPARGDDRVGEQPTRRRTIKLRDVLESIRSGAALDGGESPPAPSDRDPTAPAAPAGPASAPVGEGSPLLAQADVEEATVSLVFREPALPPAAAQGDARLPPADREAAPPRPQAPAADAGRSGEDEAEVTIVSRPR
jgi:hypothetical protein